MALPRSGGISGLALTVGAVGAVLIISGLKNATILDALRALLKGSPVPSQPSMIDAARSEVAAASGLAQAAPGSGTVLGSGTVGGGVQWGMDAGVRGASDRVIWQAVQAIMPGLKVVSAYRPGSRAPSGNLDNHSMGQAVDVVGTEAQLDELTRRLGQFGAAAGHWVTNDYFKDFGWRVPGHAPGDNMHVHVGMTLAAAQRMLAAASGRVGTPQGRA